jgi:membrane fusion protein (multidrug efflux system)
VSLPKTLSISLFALVLPFAAGCAKEEQKAAPAPPSVDVVAVEQRDVPIFSEWVGALDGLVNATIRAQVKGILLKQDYREGDPVRKGQVLFEIDPQEYEAAVAQAQAALEQAKGAASQSRAYLEQAKAEVAVKDSQWTTAKVNLARVKPLVEQNALSRKDLDDAVGRETSSQAAVWAAKAAVVASEANIVASDAAVIGAEASLQRKRIDLGYTKVASPIDGVAGIAKAQIGNLVGAGSTEELTSVSTIDPIKCYIALSEREYMHIAQARPAQGGKIPLELILADGTTYPEKGEPAFADRQVDTTTGTIRVATLFPNPTKILRPGQFGRIRAEMNVKRGARLVPQRAVTELQGKFLVAVVGADNKVAIRPVKVGERVGQLWVIDEGLEPGEKVVAEGIQKVREGTVVNPKPFVQSAAPAGAATGAKP